jgi:hypothetical protein
MLALEVPALKATLFAALAVGALVAIPKHHSHAHRLVLHAVDRPHTLYLTYFEDGPIRVNIDPDHLKPLRWEMTADVTDGCRWHSVETLTPSGPHRFAYSYFEEKLSCVPHPIPTIVTPRIGWVDVQ